MMMIRDGRVVTFIINGGVTVTLGVTIPQNRGRWRRWVTERWKVVV
jgi:hypothetical protein